MLSCQQASELLSQGLDRRLTVTERMGVRIHLLMCRLCTQYEKQLRFVCQASRRFSNEMEQADQETARLPPEARERIKKAVKQNLD